MELSPRLILALNMTDVARQQGMTIDTAALEAALKIPVIPMVASKNKGPEKLVETIIREYRQPEESEDIRHVEANSQIKEVIDHVEQLLGEDGAGFYPGHWAAMKLLEGDEQINKLVRQTLPENEWTILDDYLKLHESAAVTIATLRFAWVEKIVAAVLKKPPLGNVSLTERLDRAATHPVYGLLILLGIMGIVFWLVYSVGLPLQGFLERVIVNNARDLVFNALDFLPHWIPSLLGDGIIGGAGVVLTFAPILFFFFFTWSILEDTGYMSRGAFVTDRFMHLIGLHGKSSLPLILGFGCNVPAVLGTRIIESERARRLTILLAPLVPCTGRMAVISIIAAAFFGQQAVLVSVGMVLFSMLMLLISGFIMNRFVLAGERTALLMELPLYHFPNLKMILLVSWHQLMSFAKRAGTIIMLMSIIVWFLSSFPGDTIGESYLAHIGQWLEPVGKLMGLNWQMMVSLLSSFVAKENTIATLGVIIGGTGSSFTESLKTMLTPAAALAFLAIQMLFIPCVATVGVIRKETNSWRWTAFSLGFQLVLSFSVAIVIFQLARLVI